MMKRYLLLLLALPLFASAQQTLTLDSCLRMAKANYPLIRQSELIRQMEQNNVKGDNLNWLPRLSFISQATYQSEVTEFNVPGFNVTFPKDQYMNALELEQTIFDAGQIRQQKETDELNAETETKKNEVEFYKLADKVSQLYTSVLLVRANVKVLDLYHDDIVNKEKLVSESLRNGLVLQSSLDALEAEELKTDQSKIEAENNLKALYSSLGLLINRQLDDKTEFSLLSIGGGKQFTQNIRPELGLFTAQKNLLDARYRLTNKQALPRLSVFGEGVYGRPGYNFINQDMRFYGKAGISLKWNIGTLYYHGQQKQTLDLNKKMVDVQQQLFELNQQLALNSKSAEIASLHDILDKDKVIVEKRHHIVETASAQLANGSITTTDYLTELNNEMQARLNQEIHQVKLMTAISDYNTLNGIPNF